MPWSNPESEDRCSKNRPVYVYDIYNYIYVYKCIYIYIYGYIYIYMVIDLKVRVKSIWLYIYGSTMGCHWNQKLITFGIQLWIFCGMLSGFVIRFEHVSAIIIGWQLCLPLKGRFIPLFSSLGCWFPLTDTIDYFTLDSLQVSFLPVDYSTVY